VFTALLCREYSLFLVISIYFVISQIITFESLPPVIIKSPFVLNLLSFYKDSF